MLSTSRFALSHAAMGSRSASSCRIKWTKSSGPWVELDGKKFTRAQFSAVTFDMMKGTVLEMRSLTNLTTELKKFKGPDVKTKFLKGHENGDAWIQVSDKRYTPSEACNLVFEEKKGTVGEMAMLGRVVDMFKKMSAVAPLERIETAAIGPSHASKLDVEVPVAYPPFVRNGGVPNRVYA